MNSIRYFAVLSFLFTTLGTSIGRADEISSFASVSSTDPTVTVSATRELLDLLSQQEQLIQALQMKNHALEVENKELRSVLRTLGDVQNQNTGSRGSGSGDNSALKTVSYHALRKEILRLMTKQSFDIPNASTIPDHDSPRTDDTSSSSSIPGSYASLYQQRYDTMDQQWKQPQYVKITCKENIGVTMRPLTEEEKIDGTMGYDTTDPDLQGNECLVVEIQAQPEFSARFALACEDMMDTESTTATMQE